MQNRIKGKILLMTPSLNYGGEEISTINIARELKRRGHQAVVMSSGGPLEKRLESHGVMFVSRKINGRGLKGILSGAIDLGNYLRNEDVSLVHAQTPWPATMAKIAMWMNGAHIPVIWHDRGIKRGNYKYVSRLANMLFDRVISNSDDEARLLVSFGLSPKKIRRIHNGLFLDDYRIKEHAVVDLKKNLGLSADSFLVGYVGRMVPEKGIKWLIEAASIIQKQTGSRNFTYLLIGNGPEKEDLSLMIHRLGLNKHFILHDFTDKIPSILNQLDALVVPSEFEPFGNIVLEGMLMGVPVLASEVGGIKEIITDHYDGIFLKPKDAGNIAEKLSEISCDHELRQKLRVNGRKKVLNYFNINRVVDELEEEYGSLLKHQDAH